MREDRRALFIGEVVRVDRDTGGAHLVVAADMVRVRAGVDDHPDRRLRNRLHRVECLVDHRFRAAVDEDDAILTEMNGDVTAGAEDDPDVLPDLDGVERGSVVRACAIGGAWGGTLLRDEAVRPLSSGRNERQRNHPRQRRFGTKSRCNHGRRSVYHFHFS